MILSFVVVHRVRRQFFMRTTLAVRYELNDPGSAQNLKDGGHKQTFTLGHSGLPYALIGQSIILDSPHESFESFAHCLDDC